MEGLVWLPAFGVLFVLFLGWLWLMKNLWRCVYAIVMEGKKNQIAEAIVLLLLCALPVFAFGPLFWRNITGRVGQAEASAWLLQKFNAPWDGSIKNFRKYHEPEFDIELVAFEVAPSEVENYRKHLNSQFQKHEVHTNQVLNCGQKGLAGWWDHLDGQKFDRTDLYGGHSEEGDVMVAYQKDTHLFVFCNWNVYWSK